MRMDSLALCARQARRQNHGFSLVEMAVVVAIIGALLSAGLAALNVFRENQNVSQTMQKQNVIREALINYLRQYKRLPCPSTDVNGSESRAAAVPPATLGNCMTTAGLIPYITLGIPRDAATDAWQGFFS